jgi:hypothetical protein
MRVGRWVNTIPQSSHRHVTVSAPCSAAGAVDDGPGDPVVSAGANVVISPISLSDESSSFLKDDCEKAGDGERKPGDGEYMVGRVVEKFDLVGVNDEQCICGC